MLIGFATFIILKGKLLKGIQQNRAFQKGGETKLAFYLKLCDIFGDRL